MIRQSFLMILVSVLLSGATAAQEHPQPGDVAHGAEKTTHQVVHPEETQGEQHERTFLGLPMWIWKLVNMILFFGFLGWLLKGAVKSGLAGRRERIRQELQEARERREKSDRMVQEIQTRLTKIEGEVEMILQRAAEEGERQKQELITAANEDAEKILRSARSEVDARVKQARKELTDYAGELAAERARRMIEESLTDADRRKLFEESLEKIAEGGQ